VDVNIAPIRRALSMQRWGRYPSAEVEPPPLLPKCDSRALLRSVNQTFIAHLHQITGWPNRLQ